MKTTTAAEIYASRNRFKRRYLIYAYETIMQASKRNAGKILGKESASLFYFVCTCYVLGKLGMKFDFLNKDDRSNIKKLYGLLST